MIERISSLTISDPSAARVRHILWRAAIIAVQLAATLAIVRWGSTDTMLLVPLAVLGTAGLLAFIRWPQLGLVFLTFAGMVVPDLGLGQVNVTVLLMATMIGLWLLDALIMRRGFGILSAPAIRPLVALAAISLVSFAMGQFGWFGGVEGAPVDAQIGGLVIFLLSIGITIATASQIRQIRWLEATTWAFIAVGGVFVLLRLTPPAWRLPQLVFQSQAIGGVFFCWFPAMSLGQALFNKKLDPKLRVLLAFLAIGLAYVAFVQNFNWKSGWVTVTVTIGVLLALRSRYLVILIGVLGGLAVLYVLPGLVATEDYSVSTRFEAWLILADMVRASPLLGLGFANYYWYTTLFSIRGWNVQFNSHNNYVDVIAQVGLAGFACLVWFFVSLALLAWRIKDQVPEGFARAYAYSSLAGLVGTIVVALLGDWLLPFVYNIGMPGMRTAVLAWLFLGGLIALSEISVPRERQGALA